MEVDYLLILHSCLLGPVMLGEEPSGFCPKLRELEEGGVGSYGKIITVFCCSLILSA